MKGHRNLAQFGLTKPERLVSLNLAEWDLLLRQARPGGVLGTIHHKLGQLGLLDQVPAGPRNHLNAAGNLARLHERVLRWEVYCVQKALADVCREFILLKGAAYLVSGLPHAGGRLQSDLDILVPKSALRAVETGLLEHGWQQIKLEKYDQRFYRQWSHELPPLIHSERRTVIDVHHNILPVTSRLRPDSEKLLMAAQAIPGTPYRRLCPEDMVLHASAHLFQDGDFSRALRELADVDGLLRAFGAEDSFWQRLVKRAPEMDLQRPLFYALRYSRRYLETPIPEKVLSASHGWSPFGPTVHVMDSLVARALDPKIDPAFGSASARWLLYVRSHWLRMPPLLLARHLTHQSLRRWIGSGKGN
jgi:hypothetical protein